MARARRRNRGFGGPLRPGRRALTAGHRRSPEPSRHWRPTVMPSSPEARRLDLYGGLLMPSGNLIRIVVVGGLIDRRLIRGGRPRVVLDRAGRRALDAVPSPVLFGAWRRGDLSIAYVSVGQALRRTSGRDVRGLSTAGSCPVIGPVIAGVIAEHTSWRASSAPAAHRAGRARRSCIRGRFRPGPRGGGRRTTPAHGSAEMRRRLPLCSPALGAALVAGLGAARSLPAVRSPSRSLPTFGGHLGNAPAARGPPRSPLRGVLTFASSVPMRSARAQARRA